MGKAIVSPVEKWPGEIVLSDPLTLPQVAAWEEAFQRYNPSRSMAANHVAILPGILACVEEWRLGGGFPEQPTVETFPVKPHLARTQLLTALVNEIAALYQDDDEIPND